MFGAALGASAQGIQDGTYLGAVNKYKNSNFLKIDCINDSTFAFVVMINPLSKDRNGKTANAHENQLLDFNNFATDGKCIRGIAKFVYYRGAKTWIGFSDMWNLEDEGSTTDPAYLDLKGRGSISSILDNLPPKSSSYNYNYNIYTFSFNDNGFSMKGIFGVTRFFEEGDYHLIDKNKMSFDFNASDPSLLQLNHNHQILVKSKGSSLIYTLPTNGNSKENKTTGVLKKDEEVYLTGNDFMEYTFVIKFDSENRIQKWGWIKRDLLKRV